MEAVLPVDSSQETFSQASLPNESTLILQIQDFTKDFSLGSAKTTPKSIDQISPSFKKNESTSKLARWKAGKSVSLTSAGLSELQENCLESITTRSEDIRGKLESPKLSSKMQMVFTSNVNLSENIIKNTVQAVDDSCIKVENKDLQVELEISGLKLQHLEKKLEGCLTSSKSTLALNAELSANVSRMVSPQKSPHELKAKTTTSQANTQREDETLSPKTLQKGLSKLLNEEIENMERLENVYQNRARSSQKKQDTVSSISSSGAKDRDLRFKQFPFDNQENTQSVLSKGLKMLDKYRDVSPLGERSPNANHETNSQRRESNQRLRSYFEAYSGTNKSESKDIENGSIAESSKSKNPGKYTKAVECTFNNNITFQNSVIEKDTQLGSDSKRKDDAKNTERNCSIEESSRTFDSKINIIVTSRTPSINMASVLEGESKRDNFRREIIFIDDDGKEKIYIIKPKEKLTIQKLETVCVDFSKEEKIFFSTQELKKENSQSEWGQLDSIQLRAIDEFCSTNENSARTNPKLQDMNSERINIYDSPYIVSLNLDKQDKDKNERISAFGQKAKFFDQDQQKTAVYKMEDLSFNNLKLHAINNSDSAFREEQSLHSGFAAAISNRWEGNPKETDRPESYLKQKISDFKHFLNEFEEAIANEPMLSPLIKPVSNESMLKQQNRNPNNTQARNSMEVKNIDLKFEKQDFCTQEFDETPKVQFTGRTEEGMTTIRKDSKQKLQHQLSDRSPKAIRAFSDKEFEVQKQRLQNPLTSPLSSNKKRFSLTKNNLNHSNSGMLKSKLTENDEEAAKVTGPAGKGHKFSRTLSTTAFLNSGSTDTTKDTFNKKTLSNSKLIKSTDKFKMDPTKVHPDTQILQNNNIKCRKPVQKSIGGGPRVEVVVLGKSSKRTNSLIEK